MAEQSRLFLGCPMPDEAAAALAEWATTALAGTGTRLVPQANLHATVLFFGSVEQEVRVGIVEAVGEVIWEPLRARIGRLQKYGQSAVGARVRLERDGHADLQARMEQGPLAELAKVARGLGHPPRRPLDLHVTLLRVRSHEARYSEIRPPAIAFQLDRIRLYESVLGTGGSTYTAIAESR